MQLNPLGPIKSWWWLEVGLDTNLSIQYFAWQHEINSIVEKWWVLLQQCAVHSILFFTRPWKLPPPTRGHPIYQMNQVDTDLLARVQVRAAAAESPAPAFSGPRWGAAGVTVAPPVRGTAAAQGRQDEGMTRRHLKAAGREAGVRPIQAWGAPALWFARQVLVLQTGRRYHPSLPLTEWSCSLQEKRNPVQFMFKWRSFTHLIFSSHHCEIVPKPLPWTLDDRMVRLYFSLLLRTSCGWRRWVWTMGTTEVLYTQNKGLGAQSWNSNRLVESSSIHHAGDWVSWRVSPSRLSSRSRRAVGTLQSGHHSDEK